MSFTDWAAVTEPKVRGTWNIHNAFLREQSEPLDFLLLFSSTAALAGQMGQSNYAAANTFLHAFVSYRHALGLSASVAEIAPIEDVGYVAERPDVLELLRATAGYIIREAELLDCIELLLLRSAPPADPAPDVARAHQAGKPRYVQRADLAMGLRSMLPITAPTNRTTWRKDPRLLLYRNIEATADTGAKTEGPSGQSTALMQFLRDAAGSLTLLRAPESAELLACEIGATILGFMMKAGDEVDLDAPMAALGLDSLVSVEVRNWMRRRLGAELTVLEIVGADSLRHLGLLAQAKMVEKYEARA